MTSLTDREDDRYEELLQKERAEEDGNYKLSDAERHEFDSLRAKVDAGMDSFGVDTIAEGDLDRQIGIRPGEDLAGSPQRRASFRERQELR